MKRTVREWRYGALAILTLIGLWQAASQALQKPYILPSPALTLFSLADLFGETGFYIAFGYTMARLLIVLSISMGLGTLLGVFAGKLFPAEALMRPIVQVARSLPTIVLIVYVGLWMSGFWAPIFVTVLITFPVVYGNALEGYKRMDRKLVEMGRLYRLSRFKMMKAIYYPSVKPYLQSGFSAILGLGLKVVIASEILSQTPNSLGRLFQIARMNVETPRVIALALFTVSVAIVFEYLSKRGFDRV
ncbi:MAG: NitT/TauT family transport system permease protein [Clostridiales bacterium]|jgi:NitT/TauT family transport system permease protein|nr:NitT/TauT family transport system permease protein [Clostridiales bacterium]